MDASDLRYKAVQTSYRIVVGTDHSQVAGGNGEMWDSKKVNNDLMLVRYDGKELHPFTKYYWMVYVWDKDGVETKSEVTSFETGMKYMKN